MFGALFTGTLVNAGATVALAACDAPRSGRAPRDRGAASGIPNRLTAGRGDGTRRCPQPAPLPCCIATGLLLRIGWNAAVSILNGFVKSLWRLMFGMRCGRAALPTGRFGVVGPMPPVSRHALCAGVGVSPRTRHRTSEFGQRYRVQPRIPDDGDCHHV